MRAWLLRPSGKQTAEAQKAIVAELRHYALDVKSTALDEVRTMQTNLGQGRQALLMNPVDVARMYRSMHKAATAIFSVGSASVPLRPQEWPHSRSVQSVDAFVRHKAAFVHISRPGNPGAAWDSAAAQLSALDWDNANDPRLLPMHCFDAWCHHDLATADGRQRFDDEYRRKDETSGRRPSGWHWANRQGHKWAQAKARHAPEPLIIAGVELPAGMHWDTTLNGTREFCNGWQVWETAKAAYINVAPNAHVRAPHVKKAWDAEDLPAPPPRAPEVGRSLAGRAALRKRKKR